MNKVKEKTDKSERMEALKGAMFEWQEKQKKAENVAKSYSGAGGKNIQLW
jgi:hypothetical protein